MGRDKALVEVGGRALARIAADALLQAGAAEVVAVGGDLGGLQALGLRAVADPHQGEGPLGGLVTALGATTAEVVVVLACDLPRITGGVVSAVVGALGDADLAVPVAGGRPQHLAAAWRRVPALAALRDGFERGERAVWRAAAPLRSVSVTLGDEAVLEDADDPAALLERGPTG